MDLETVAEELYGLDPADFTAVRNQRVKQARAESGRELAEQIKALRKPTAAAWLTNQLVREHRAEVEALLDLGRELREVMADLGADELRELTRQRYRLVSALVQQARTLARGRGHPVSDAVAQSVRTTLEATLADSGSANEVATARLAEGLEVSGFGAVGDTSVAAPAAPTAGTTATVTDLGSARQRRLRQRAQHDLEAAEKAAKQAEGARDTASRAVEATERRRDEAVARADRARQELDRAGAALTETEEAAAEARSELAAADEAAEQAAASLSQARERLSSLPQEAQ